MNGAWFSGNKEVKAHWGIDMILQGHHAIH